MIKKIKAAPKSTGGEVLDMLKLVKDHLNSGYATKMGNLLNFLNLTSGIRIGAEVVENDLNIDDSGKILALEQVRKDYAERLISSFEWNNPEVEEIRKLISETNTEIFDRRTIIRRKNTDKKKEKARLEIEDFEKINKDRYDTIVDMVATRREQVEATNYSIEEMREQMHLLTGCKIKIDLTTGSYTFPVPVDTPFYREVCTILKLPLPNQEAAKKPVVKRMFTIPADALQAIKTAAKFASIDDLRPAMTCVVLEINKGKMLVVATDAHRLFKSRQFAVSGPPGSYTYLMPVSALKRLPKSVSEDFILYELKGEKVGICGLTVDLMDARFPDWKCVMPKYTGYMEFHREDFIYSVKSVLPFCNKSTAQVNIDINGEIRMDKYIEKIMKEPGNQ